MGKAFEGQAKQSLGEKSRREEAHAARFLSFPRFWSVPLLSSASLQLLAPKLLTDAWLSGQWSQAGLPTCDCRLQAEYEGGHHTLCLLS